MFHTSDPSEHLRRLEAIGTTSIPIFPKIKIGLDMEYGVFKVNQDNVLELQATFKTKELALAHIRAGVNMILLEIYL